MYHQFVPGPTENWRAVPDTDGRVEVSDRGRVRPWAADGRVALRR
jgi:hypothetical protein